MKLFRIIYALLICWFIISCERSRDKRIYGCFYNVATDTPIERVIKIELREKIPYTGILYRPQQYSKIWTFETNGQGCYDEIIEFGNKTDYEIEIMYSKNDVFDYDYEYSSITDVLVLNDQVYGGYNHDKMNVSRVTNFHFDKNDFKRKNKEIEINFSTVLYGKLNFVLNNSGNFDSITVYAKNPYFEDVIFSNSNLPSKTSKEYMLPVCPITLRYEVVKNGVTTTTTEEILIKEDELTTVTHNY